MFGGQRLVLRHQRPCHFTLSALHCFLLCLPWLLLFLCVCVGHRTRASSSSPPPRRPFEDHHRHGSDLNHSGAPPRGGRDFSSRRESSGRYRDYSPPHARVGRRFDGPEPTHGRPFKSDGIGRNNNYPKVQPRDGDWYCLDPL